VTTHETADVAKRLFEWAERSEFSGHDPHDILSSPLLRRLRLPIARLIALQVGRRSLVNLRTLLRVPKAENPKALALFLSGLLRGREAIFDDWQLRAERLANRLAAAMKQDAWGYPFPWQSRTHFIPAHVPNIVTTSFAGIALVEHSRAMDTKKYEKPIRKAADYILKRIPRHQSDGIAFGYAERDPQIVFNASLLGAEFLANVGEMFGEESYLDLARDAARFVIAHQRSDGSWLYGLEPSQTWIDSFHTGFVILSLKEIARVTKDATFEEAAQRGFEYYRRTFVEKDFAVRYHHHERYPIDAHVLGQSLVTLAAFNDIDTANKVAEWSTRHMLSSNGYFYYRRYRLMTNRIAYMRWSNAWMFRGLSELLMHG
jgi:hypothetical protein